MWLVSDTSVGENWIQGITCDSRGRVTVLNLLDVFAFPNASPDTKLKIKPGVKGAGSSLGDLKALRELEFRNVRFGFVHPIPAQLGGLPALVSLHLIGTQFVGAIPTDLGRLTRLNHLILEGNRFSSGIPVRRCEVLFSKTLCLGVRRGEGGRRIVSNTCGMIAFVNRTLSAI